MAWMLAPQRTLKAKNERSPASPSNPKPWAYLHDNLVREPSPMTDPHRFRPNDLLIATVAGLLAYMITLGLRMAFGS